MRNDLSDSSTPALPAAVAEWAETTWRRAVAKLDRTSRRIGDTFPHVSREGRYDSAPPEWWTAGFWPGLLWLVYREQHDERLRGLAESCERKLDAALWQFDGLHHDVGFMWTLTSVARFKLLGQDDSRRRALLAASVLGARYNVPGRFIRAWNHGPAGWAIVDCMMNLPLLFWASETVGDPRFRYLAMAHADTALRHFVRADGSCNHVVSFHPETGEFLEALGGQGLAPDSAWSRGCAWATYGFALCHRATGETRYLEAALRVARFFAANLPDDYLPPWDFHAPPTPDRPLDSSAAACFASAALELAHHVRGAEAGMLRRIAVSMLQALDEKCAAWDLDEEGLLRFGTGNKPDGSNINVPLIYGDYFFVEALAKLRGRIETFW